LAETSTTASGATSCSAVIFSAVAPFSEKWIGAVHVRAACSTIFHQLRLNPSFLKSYFLSISMPGTPKNVGNSGDMTCVRSTTDWKLRCASTGVTAVAANPAALAAAAPRKNPRRDKAR
jgi:hypothetical protein